MKNIQLNNTNIQKIINNANIMNRNSILTGAVLSTAAALGFLMVEGFILTANSMADNAPIVQDPNIGIKLVLTFAATAGTLTIIAKIKEQGAKQKLPKILEAIKVVEPDIELTEADLKNAVLFEYGRTYKYSQYSVMKTEDQKLVGIGQDIELIDATSIASPIGETPIIIGSMLFDKSDSSMASIIDDAEKVYSRKKAM